MITKPKLNPIQILKKAGITIQTCFAISDYLIRGEFKAVKVRGFDYKSWKNPPSYPGRDR